MIFHCLPFSCFHRLFHPLWSEHLPLYFLSSHSLYCFIFPLSTVLAVCIILPYSFLAVLLPFLTIFPISFLFLKASRPASLPVFLLSFLSCLSISFTLLFYLSICTGFHHLPFSLSSLFSPSSFHLDLHSPSPSHSLHHHSLSPFQFLSRPLDRPLPSSPSTSFRCRPSGTLSRQSHYSQQMANTRSRYL